MPDIEKTAVVEDTADKTEAANTADGGSGAGNAAVTATAAQQLPTLEQMYGRQVLDPNDYFDEGLRRYWKHLRARGQDWPSLADLLVKQRAKIAKSCVLDETIRQWKNRNPDDKSYRGPRTVSAYAAAEIILRTGDVAYTETEDDGTRVMMYYNRTGAYAGIWTENKNRSYHKIRQAAANLGVANTELDAAVKRVIDRAPVIKEDNYRGIAMFTNGVLDIATKTLTPYTLADGAENPAYKAIYGGRAFFWKMEDTDWPESEPDEPEYTCADGFVFGIHRHLHTVLGGDPIAIRAIWQWYSFAVRGIYGGKTLMLIDGTGNAAGAGGKSTTLDVAVNILGKRNVFFCSLDEAAERFGLAGLVGKRLIVGKENNSHKSISNSSLVKALTRGEEVSVEKKGVDKIPYQFRGAIANAMQSGIRTDERSSAFYRKFLVIPFTHTLTKTAERDVIQTDFITRKEFREYVAYRAIMDYGDIEQFDQDIVDALKENVDAIRMNTSPIYKFCAEVLPMIQNEWVPFDAFYSAYRRYCPERGYSKPGNEDTFLLDFNGYTADHPGWQFVNLKQPAPARQFSRKSLPEPFLALYGDEKWRKNKDLRDNNPDTASDWAEDKLGTKQRRWIVRVTDGQQTAPNKAWDEDDYRLFVGMWYFSQYGAKTFYEPLTYDEWVKAGKPMPEIEPDDPGVSANRAGFHVKDWKYRTSVGNTAYAHTCGELKTGGYTPPGLS